MKQWRAGGPLEVPGDLDFCLKPNRAAVWKGIGASGKSNTGKQACSDLDEAGVSDVMALDEKGGGQV